VPLLSSIAAAQHSEAPASIELLLRAGAAVDATSTTTVERTALMMACCVSHNDKVVEALLQGGANPCYQSSSDGKSALHLAAAMGCIDTCKMLHTASSGRALELAGKGYPLAATHLIAACAMRHLAVVELLCTLGADVNNSCVVTGNTPLIVAAQWEDTAILQLLLRQDGIKVNQRNGDGDTALLKAANTAATSGNTAAAATLILQKGADACMSNKQGVSPIFAAVTWGHMSMLELLMQHGADDFVTADRGYTLLMHAAKTDQSEAAEFLIDKGLSVQADDDIGYTALHYAAASTSEGTETMRVLLAHGADVSARNTAGGTPLHATANSGQPDKLK
jgi:ankyrin repeat protein